MKKNSKKMKNWGKIEFARRAGIEPAYSDYEPNELPVTQPPQKDIKTKLILQLMNRMQRIVQINTKKNGENVSLQKRNK
jgi:hypothetical protein